MAETQPLIDRIFGIQSREAFDEAALEVFRYQYENNSIYRQFCDMLKRPPEKVVGLTDIPFLPVEMFKHHRVVSFKGEAAAVFASSGTTAGQTSRHYVRDVSLYEMSFSKCFRMFYGEPSAYCILALLPSYLERNDSSLVYMANGLMKQGRHPENGFFLDDHNALIAKMKRLSSSGQPILLLGVSFALLDLAEKHRFNAGNITIIETGGMKGRRKELTREELHDRLKDALNVDAIHAEYGMTELLSQAYSYKEGLFACPPWMRVLIRDPNDPLTITDGRHAGGINVIDLANLYSCSFLATQDLGRLSVISSQAAGNVKTVGHDCRPALGELPAVSDYFEVIGRFDYSDTRGCNLMLAGR